MKNLKSERQILARSVKRILIWSIPSVIIILYTVSLMVEKLRF